MALHPATGEVVLRVKRDGVPASAKIRSTIVVKDGLEIYQCRGGVVSGGDFIDRRSGIGIVRHEYSLRYELPNGFFGESTRQKRLGERNGRLSAWYEVEVIEGTVNTTAEMTAIVVPPSTKPYHSSVAYQNAGSTGETAGGDGQVSFSFTAGAGTDRVAFVFGATARDTRPTSASVTYAGSISSDLGDTTNTYWRGAGGLAWDSLISSGAQTVAFASSGGGGTQYATCLGVISVTGAHQTTHGTVATNGADTGTALTCNLGATPASDSLSVVGWNYAVSGGGAGTTGADQTVRTSQSMGSGQERGYWETQPGSAGTALTHTKANTNWEWVAMGIELKAAAAAAAPVLGRQTIIKQAVHRAASW